MPSTTMPIAAEIHPATLRLRGLATINLWADDVPAAAAWYANLLGIAPYFQRSGPDGRPVYVEFRIGDHQDELGIIDRRWRPTDTADTPGGTVVHWHVDDLETAVEALLAHGAREFLPVTPHGDAGFVTASVVDPFGNVLGVMTNPHWAALAGSSSASDAERKG